MGQGDSDFLAPVFEAEHLLHTRCRQQIRRPVPPGIDHQSRMRLDNSANDPVWLLEKQITSHRPTPGTGTNRPARGHVPCAGQIGTGSRRPPRRSQAPGTSLVNPVGPGHSGHWSGSSL